MYSARFITSRIRIALKLRGQQVLFQTLPGIFEVAHLDNKLPDRDLRSVKGPSNTYPCFFQLQRS